MCTIAVQSPKRVIEVGARALTHPRTQAMDIGVTSGVHRAFQVALELPDVARLPLEAVTEV